MPNAYQTLTYENKHWTNTNEPTDQSHISNDWWISGFFKPCPYIQRTERTATRHLTNWCRIPTNMTVKSTDTLNVIKKHPHSVRRHPHSVRRNSYSDRSHTSVKSHLQCQKTPTQWQKTPIQSQKTDTVSEDTHTVSEDIYTVTEDTHIL